MRYRLFFAVCFLCAYNYAFPQAGNVGIGSTNPQEKLDVDGRVLIHSTTKPTDTANRLYNVSGDLFWQGIRLTYDTMQGDTFNAARKISRVSLPGYNSVITGKDKSLASFVEAYFFPFLPATISLGSNVSLVEVGTTNTATLTVTEVQNQETVFTSGHIDRTVPAQADIYTWGAGFAATRTTTVSFDPTTTPNTNTYVAYQLVGNNGSPTTLTSSSVTLEAIYPIFYGINTTDFSGGGTALYEGLTKLMQKHNSPSKNKTVSINGTGYVYFAYPASYGDLSQIIDHNGFPVGFSSFDIVTADVSSTVISPGWTNVSYKIYKLHDQTTLLPGSSWQFIFP